MAEPEAEDPVPWRYRRSLRFRITLVTAVVVALVIAIGGVLILVALESDLEQAADDAGVLRADEVATLAERGTLPDPLEPMRDPESYAQVVAGSEVVTATDGHGSDHPFGLPEQAPGETSIADVARLPLDATGPYRVVSRGVDTPTGPVTVHIAVPVDDVEHTVKTAARIVAIGLSLMVLALATVLWFAIGRTLAPVNAIRVRADAITAERLDRRVPVPPQRDEIGRLARTVNQMLSRLESSAERQRRFVADAAHELRTPIASLRAQLETADRRRPGTELDDLVAETLRMQLLVDQLLILARADADTSWARRVVVDLDDVVDSAVASLDPSPQITVDTSAVEPVQLTGDAGLLERVVRNLLDNAVGYATAAVRVSLSAEGGVAVLTVDDDGPGVPVGRREEVFERFVRLDDARDRDRGGVGLGLAIAEEIVRAHGGRVLVEDAPSGGARFVVTLPTYGPAGAEEGSTHLNTPGAAIGV
jgi:signal transduction histidine kinase